MFRGIVVAVALLGALPASAHAADISVDANGVLRYTGAPGKQSNVRFTETGAATVSVEQFTSTSSNVPDDNLVAGAGCTPSNPSVCAGVKSAVLDAGDLSDRVEAGWLQNPNDPNTFTGLKTIPTTITGGDGNDVLAGGGVTDSIEGGAGDDDIDGFAGDDTIKGNDGNDDLKPNTGRDTVVGGDGIDTAIYGRRDSPTFTLDAQRNDGSAGEGDLIGADIENVEGAANTDAQTVTIVGDTRANRLTVPAGRANLTGGDGADILEGGPQDDTINSRDGVPDVVICNGGTDTVLADTNDQISPSCENVQIQATPGGAFDDRPPTLVWASPGPSADLSASNPTVLSVNAADDRGLTKVQFFDDDRLLCEIPAAPFNCSYQPRGGDVGRNTLVAVAFDGAGQSTTAVRAVTVRRFAPKSMTLSLRPSRDRKAPYAFSMRGKITRPDPVSPSQGCSGTITFSVKKGTRVIQTKRVSLTRTCEYRTTFSFRKRTAKRLRFQAKFGGNEVLSSASSRTRTARLG
jgi:hypothetical protein